MITIPTFTGASTALAATLTTSLAPLIMLLVEAPMLEKVVVISSQLHQVAWVSSKYSQSLSPDRNGKGSAGAV